MAVEPGQSLSGIVGERMPAGTSDEDIVSMCQRLYDLNRGTPAVGDTIDVIYAGQKLIVPDDLEKFSKLPKNVSASQLQFHRP
ncbi:MAG: hypothetical protein IPJ65_21695 [Archangiaceae bacterium]|nr:hypothetical protein [Archangiaceae bacterium]